MTDLFEYISVMFSYTFILRALIAGALVSLCAALLGVSLVLNNIDSGNYEKKMQIMNASNEA